jgi:hypothetical protein
MNEPISIRRTMMYCDLIRVIIAISLGRNPVRGGIPAIEHIINNKIRYENLVFCLILICVIVFMFENIIVIKIGVTVIK